MVEGEGFEPSKLARQIYSLIPLAAREPLLKRGAIMIYIHFHVKPLFTILSVLDIIFNINAIYRFHSLNT